jgi:serine/threonine protein phosphatase PrpC
MKSIASTFLERGNPELQDRLENLQSGGNTVFVVADGVGGRAGAAQAAEFLVRTARNAARNLASAQDCLSFLCELDQKIALANDCGETTGVITVVSGAEIFGANVGDSAAWLFTTDVKAELTRVRKPYLGTGVATPHQFARRSGPGTLVVASDGLWKYTSLELIELKVRTVGPERLAAELAELVRLRSGAFPDDIAIATCRTEL